MRLVQRRQWHQLLQRRHGGVVDPQRLAVTADALWVTDQMGGKVVRYDKQSHAIVASIAISAERK